MKLQTPASSLQPVNRQVDDMKNSIPIALAAALFAAPATAAPASVQDRIADLCSVSNTDLEGQRLAKACRTQVRASFAAEQRAEAAARVPLTRLPLRIADAAPVRPR
ncbi:hypothetical protein [Sphingomonas kaistensis]|nr:hypothetical protein [Sphingomonas kaistensis]